MLNERKNVKQKISQDEQLFSRQNDVGSKKANNANWVFFHFISILHEEKVE